MRIRIFGHPIFFCRWESQRRFHQDLLAPQKCSRSARLSQPHWSVLIYTAMQSHNQLHQFDSTTIPWWVLINCYVSVDQVCGKHASRHDGCLKVLWQNSFRKITILVHKIFPKKLPQTRNTLIESAYLIYWSLV